jgi:hypothetical protein
MKLELWQRRRRSGVAAGRALLGAGGVAAGAALFYFLDPRRGRGPERRARAADRLRAAEHEVEGRARDLTQRAARALETAEQRVETGTRDLSGRARELSQQARSTVAANRSALEARGFWNQRTLTGAAGGILIARALFGRGILRIPAGIVGYSMLSRFASESEAGRRGVQRVKDAARQASEGVRAVAEGAGLETSGAGAPRAGGASAGGERGPGPEVREVKSPAELEPGVASGRPEPTFPDRADRSGPHMGSAGSNGGEPRDPHYDAAATESGDASRFSTPGTADIAPPTRFGAAPAGADVREGDLGMVLPREGGAEEDERDERGSRILSPGEGAGPRLAGGPDDLAGRITTPEAARHEGEASGSVLGPDAIPVQMGEDPGDAPRITGAEDEDPATRRASADDEASRKDPTSDGG